jgi:hypothetical protein
MELFDTNIDHFSDINPCQHIFLSLLLESDDLSLFSNKNKLLNQNWIWKKLKHQNHIICIIFTVRRSKYIFLETFGTPPMFSVFFISVSILTIPSLTKKLEAIVKWFKIKHQNELLKK